MVQLIQLRWIAVFGQLVTIAVAERLLGVDLPVGAMLLAPAALALLNLVSLPVTRRRETIANGELFVALLLDVVALTVQLYLSGGATNPFISLFLLQVVIGAVLLERWSTAALIVLTSLCFALLTIVHRPLHLPPRHAGDPFGLYIQGSWVCFVLVGTLLVLFVTRINQNLRERDACLADIRQHAAEEDHIVRMGLLATGAAHELGTPLSTLSVILGDWRHMPELVRNPELSQEIEEMQASVERCKSIVTGILHSAGEARGESPVITTVHRFLDDVVEHWCRIHGFTDVSYVNRFGDDVAIVPDSILKQVIWNILDNAANASADWIGLEIDRHGDALTIAVRDRGPGFAPERLARFGKPYQTSKRRAGHGLGLFLVVNVMRKLGGEVQARNLADGGALVTLTLPLSAVRLSGSAIDGA